tara:strand:- start:49 stop:552 length:504 start_codon:yes stop_codon:yes gene_type:complete
MAKISGNFGSGQTTNGVLELLSPLAMVWRRAIEWGGTSALDSDGVSITFTNTNLPKEGQVVKVNSSGKAIAVAAGDDTNESYGVVWTGYDQSDSGAVDTITMLDSGYMLFDVDASLVHSATAGALMYFSASVQKWTTTTTDAVAHGVCEQTAIVRGGKTFTRIKWTR